MAGNNHVLAYPEITEAGSAQSRTHPPIAKNMNSILRAFIACVVTPAVLSPSLVPAAPNTAAESINTTGLALHAQTPVKSGNALISPWSIQSVMAVLYAGAGAGSVTM